MKEKYINDSMKLSEALGKCRERAEKIKKIEKRYLYELAELICDEIDLSGDVAEDLRGVYREVINNVGGNISEEDKALISAFMAQILKDKMGKEFLATFGVITSPKPSTVSYVKNAYSDMAYRAFDLQLGGIYSEYADGFVSAAQSVYYENSSACILPITADDGSLMSGIAKLVEKYDLKKASLAGVATGGVQNTMFALFTHGIWQENGADTVEFTVKTSDSFNVVRIIGAGYLFGFCKVSHNERVSSDSGELYDLFTMKGIGYDSFLSLMVYLTVEFERFNLIGIYKEFEE